MAWGLRRGRSAGRAVLALVGTVLLPLCLAGCGGTDLDGDVSVQTMSGPDDVSDLWAALRWGIEVDYPQRASVAELTEAADLVVRGRVVQVARHGADPASDHADVTLEVERVLSDPDGRRPATVLLSIPINGQNDVGRIDAEAVKPSDVIVAVAELEGEPGVAAVEIEPRNAGGPTRDRGSPALFGMVSNDGVIGFRHGVSYTPFNDLGEAGDDPAPDDPYRGRTLADLEAAFLSASTP